MTTFPDWGVLVLYFRSIFADNREPFGMGASSLLMTFVLLCVFAFGANGLYTDSIWTDELYAITNMGGFDGPYSPAEVVNSVAEHFPDHVPLFFLLGAGWANFVGWTQFALRLLPVFAGVLMLAWTYRLASDMFDRFAGLAAATLLGSSAYMVLYIHDFRMYSLFLMLTAMHMWLYWRLLERKSRDGRLTLVAFALSTVALFYTHFFAGILFAGLGVFHLLFGTRSRRWRQILLGWAIGALLFLPYLPVLVDGVQRASEKADVTSRAAAAPELLRTLALLLSNGSLLTGAMLAGVLAYVVARRRPLRLIKLLAIPLTMVTFIILANALIGIIPLTRMRYFIVIWIPVSVLLGACLANVPRRRLVSGIVLLVWLLSGYQYYRSEEIMNHVGSMVFTRLYPPLPDYVWHLKGKLRSEDYLLGFSKSSHVNKVLTLGKSVADYYTQEQLGIDGAFIRRGAYGEWLEGEIRQWMGNQPFLLFAFNPQDLPNSYRRVREVIENNYLPCDVVVDQPHLFVQRHVNSRLSCDRESRPIAYENGVTLVDRYAQYDPEKQSVYILSGWEVESEEALDEYNVSLQFITPDWQRLGAQIDRHLYDKILPWFTAELSTEDLPPGDYRVMVILYDRESRKKVRGVDLAGGWEDSIFPIASFTVEA
ncbi:MAG: glycosyltransferase family 39 protein [Chloroflexi bacterium]|nr:glycosyltransferase family 39 protein [Chloroflexota bacterium]